MMAGNSAIPRFLIFSHEDIPLGELDPNQLLSAKIVEEINGEHSLSFTTTQILEKQSRVIYEDDTGKTREFVIEGVTETHTDLTVPLNTYYCVWSLQHDLECTIVNSTPGMKQTAGKTIIDPVTSRVALEAALAGTARWTVGTITQNTEAYGSMYYKSGYEALGVVVEFWGGEIDADITLDRRTSEVLSRKVSLYNMIGGGDAVRRFDYSHDMESISRVVSDKPFTCRITPRGKGEETENGGFGRRITIASVNGGVEWIQDDEAVSLSRVPNGKGGYEYPNQIVVFEDIADPQTLLDYAREHIQEYTRPRVTYKADVTQLEAAGMDAHGVALGDVVQCVDKSFSEEGLRIEGRIRKLQIDLLGLDEIVM